MTTLTTLALEASLLMVGMVGLTALFYMLLGALWAPRASDGDGGGEDE
jgi:biotin transporter BioY